MAYKLSPETKDAIDRFKNLDTAFKAEWEAFENKYKKTLEKLDQLREQRNAALDEARQAMRAEAAHLPVEEKSVFYSGFRATKPEGYVVDVNSAYRILDGKGLVQKALDDAVLKYEYKADYEEFCDWTKKQDLETDFKDCIKPKDLAVTVVAPKTIPPFGAEYKEKK